MSTRLRVLFCAIGVMATAVPGRAADILLNGPWRFAYQTELCPARVIKRFSVAVMVEPQPQVPADDQFALELHVPGYWDDQLSYIPEAPWGNTIAYNESSNAVPIRFPYPRTGRPRHPDAGTPFVTGVGWYKRTFDAPAGWQGRTVTLRVGGARIDTYCYLNGIYVDMHHGHDTPFEFDLTDEIRYGQTNELLLAVNNRVPWINSCALRGYAGMSGGIYGDVHLHVSEGPGRITSYYVCPEDNLRRLRWKAELTAPTGMTAESRLAWSISSSAGATLHKGYASVRAVASHEHLTMDWSSSSEGVRPWSIWEPHLHRIELRWENANGALIDAVSRPYGLRQLESRDVRLFLNGRPILLRGACDIYHFPPDVHPPNDVEYFRRRLRRLKEVGFNYLRFHTWVPMKPYLQAADEIGMLMGPEYSLSPTRNLLDDDRWAAMVRECREHPSVVTYCGGNEEVGHEGLISRFAERYRQAKVLAPDALVIPMHTMSGPESKSGRADLPMPPHLADEDGYYAALWGRVTRHADVFAARANDFSYSNFTGRDWRLVDPEYTHYKRPILAHETGILGTYIDLSLESRCTGTMPADLYRAAREYIKSAGRLDRATIYHQNSARWHGQARKYVLENLRKCPSFDGYDLLGGWDSHWHNAGYGCGLLNEFLELKPGDTAERVLQYNGESVLLLDNAGRHVFEAGAAFDMPVMASLYGDTPLRDATLAWRVRDGNTILLSGELCTLQAADGAVTPLGNIQFTWSRSAGSRHVVLEVELKGSGYHIRNQWDFWVFSERPAPAVSAAADEPAFALLAGRYPGLRPIDGTPQARLRIVRSLTKAEVDHLAAGGDVVLLGSKPFPANETRYQIGIAGRAHMNLATVIRHHPSLKHVPHAGWCDRQFQQLLEGGQCVEFNKFPAEFDPIVEVVSSYKYIRLQAALWEARTEGGRIFATSFHLDMNDPVAVALLDGIMEYVQSESFRPTVTVTIDGVLRPLLAGIPFRSLKGNDGNYYSGMGRF